MNEILSRLIQEKIKSADGTLSFHDFMNHVLYHPTLGYYMNGKHKFGPQGDFITAPEISSLFSYSVAYQCDQVFKMLGKLDILELGAGSGKMAGDILRALAEKNNLPAHYVILEPSPDLQALQKENLQIHYPDIFPVMKWSNTLPSNFSGVILANEVMDAFPINIFHWEKKEFLERGVSYQKENNQFVWQDKAIDKNSIFFSELKKLPVENFYKEYISEINLFINPWLASLSDSLKKGLILLSDYGFLRQEYYHPQRHQGTLMCHHRHLAHTNPFLHLGLQDITAHVDFTAVKEAAHLAQLTISGYTTQSNFLINCGILQEYEKKISHEPQNKLALQHQLHRLVEPHDMGELFKFIALSRGLDDLSLAGFNETK